jgi:hypothetical protein
MSRSSKSRNAIVLLVLCNFSLAQADDSAVTCPAAIEVMQSPANIPAGWRAGTSGGVAGNGRCNLANIGFSEGPPAEQVSLAPDSGKKLRRSETQTWLFSPGAPQGYWIACEYAQTSVTLTRRLPERIRTCTVTYDSSTSPPTAQNVNCK